MRYPASIKAQDIAMDDEIDGLSVSAIERTAAGNVKVLLENVETGDCDWHEFWPEDSFIVIRTHRE